jgi:hypothetical protein
MKMHMLSGGRLRTRRSAYITGAAEGDTIELSVFRAAQACPGQRPVRYRLRSLIADNTEARWGSLANLIPIITRGNTFFLMALPRGNTKQRTKTLKTLKFPATQQARV